MTTRPPQQPRRDLEVRLSRLLTACVIIAAAVGLLGLALHLTQHRGPRPDLSTFTPGPEHLREPAQIASHAARLDSAAVLQLGVVLLILTPVLRVVFSLVMFATRRDWLYVGITAIVLAALAVGLVIEH